MEDMIKEKLAFEPIEGEVTANTTTKPIDIPAKTAVTILMNNEDTTLTANVSYTVIGSGIDTREQNNIKPSSNWSVKVPYLSSKCYIKIHNNSTPDSGGINPVVSYSILPLED